MTLSADSGREQVYLELRRELFGPDEGARTFGQPIVLDPIPILTKEESYGPFHDAVTGEEILTRDRPTKRYGVGVLYPRGEIRGEVSEDDPPEDSADDDREHRHPAANQVAESERVEQWQLADEDDFDLAATGEFKPSSMAVSFLARFEESDVLLVSVTGARYEAKPVVIDGREKEWFVRRPLKVVYEFSDLHQIGLISPATAPATDPLHIDVKVLVRAHGEDRLCTVALVNLAGPQQSGETYSLFQAAFEVTVQRGRESADAILPYPDAQQEGLLQQDEEARSLDLLFSNVPTFAVGHGCSAAWSEPWGRLRCSSVRAEALPTYEAPSVTPEVKLSDGRSLAVPMAPLAGLDRDDDGFGALASLVGEYRAWIVSLEQVAAEHTGFRLQAARDHIAKCERVHARMRDGLAWLEGDPVARRAFTLANRAMLNQQLNYRSEVRPTTLTRDGYRVEEPEAPLTWQQANWRWRPFQIGFLLASARSTVVATDAERDTVELIFFPTGGGKTEAYLALAAFSLFYSRLTGGGTGVEVLMRYTLRLLTTQQLTRAASLICSMEILREEEQIPGAPFTIGIWVGGGTTPNTREQAISAFRSLSKGRDENPFLLIRCPWCAAQMGPVSAEKNVPQNEPRLAGYRESRGVVQFRCPDRRCRFRRGIPVYVVDEDVYENRPSIVIGTVDKFAQLVFRPDARRIFGLGVDGSREVPPPNLIIQDELHLIAGPLGSMVGLYEAVVEDLCTGGGAIGARPKIVGSTATIRNFTEQIKGLYGRSDAVLFPPHGLCTSDSFFARHARDDESGALMQGRRYVGVHAPGLGSVQTAQVRTGAALLQAPLSLPDELRDPWWTSLMFFNSLRELGTSVSLLQSDIPDYLFAKRLRDGSGEQRYINQMMELTSRLRQDQIPEAISKLERRSSGGNAVDVCLSSNIIEVGVDIPRLSLLTVLGQPKTTSQYIQITGRVGRNWMERPGLVVTVYSASRPRDRSHFEKFQSYHQRLYAEVEPVSVTPFSSPVLRRAAHAVVVAHIRQRGDMGIAPWPLPESLFDEAESLLLERAEVADPTAVRDVKRELGKRRSQWLSAEPAVWEARTSDDEGPLIRRAGEWVPDDTRELSWEVPMSMRDVDAECRVSITNRYALARGDFSDEDSE